MIHRIRRTDHEKKITVKEYEPRYFKSEKGTDYRIINFMGQLKVYKRYSKQISATEYIAGEKEVKPTKEILQYYVAEPYRR